MKVCVLGGLGFIGSHLVERLMNEGHEVTIIDNRSTGCYENLDSVPDGFILIEKDVAGEDLSKEFSGQDFIFHLANRSCGIEYEMHPREAVMSAVAGFVNVMETARKVKVGKVIYASSASTYGNTPGNYQNSCPFSLYGETRRFFERVGFIYRDTYKLPTVGLRLFSVYGPRSENKLGYASVVNQFVRTMMKGESPVIWGDGFQKRDYVYVADVVQAFINAMTFEGNGFEVGRGESFSYNTVAAFINNVLGTSIVPVYAKKEFTNYVDETLCTNHSFEPDISLYEGIKKLVGYYRGKGL